jgi:hypothetical protein
MNIGWCCLIVWRPIHPSRRPCICKPVRKDSFFRQISYVVPLRRRHRVPLIGRCTPPLSCDQGRGRAEDETRRVVPARLRLWFTANPCIELNCLNARAVCGILKYKWSHVGGTWQRPGGSRHVLTCMWQARRRRRQHCASLKTQYKQYTKYGTK